VKVNFLKEYGILTVTLKEKGNTLKVITSNAFVLITLLDGEIADIEMKPKKSPRQGNGGEKCAKFLVFVKCIHGDTLR